MITSVKKQMKNIFFIVLVGVLLIGVVSAVPPFQQEAGADVGLTLRYPPVDVLKEGDDISYHIHVHNASNGMLLTNESIECSVHLYNSTGNHILEERMGFKEGGVDFYLDIGGGNFTTGKYSFITWCNSSAEGGFVSGAFDVTESGRSPPSGIVIIFFSALFVLVVVGMLSLLMHTIFHFINLDYDSKDLTYSLSAYFGLFAVYILSMEYLGNAFVDDFLLFLLEIGAVTTVFLPIIAFVVSFIKLNTEKKDHN